MDEQSQIWQKINVKQSKRRLKPSNLANRSVGRQLNMRTGINRNSHVKSPMLALQNIKIQGMSPPVTQNFNGHYANKTNQSGWNNPDFSTLKGSGLVNMSNQSGEFVVQSERQMNRQHLSREGRNASELDKTASYFGPESIQIKLKLKPLALGRISPNQGQQNMTTDEMDDEALDENEDDNEDEQELAVVKDPVMTNTLHGDFPMTKERASMQLGEIIESGLNQPTDVNLIDMAEKYLQSNKQQVVKQKEFEQQIMNQYREAQVSRMSSSAIGEDHVLVGGRITAVSGISNIQMSSQGKPNSVPEGHQTEKPPKKINLATDAVTMYDVNASQQKTPVTAEKQNLPSLRQIVVQNKKETKKKTTMPITKDSNKTFMLLKSNQEQKHNVPGLIYSEKADNLTISKDILYNDDSTIKTESVTRRRDSDQHQALKELLRSQGVKQIAKGRYADGTFSQQDSQSKMHSTTIDYRNHISPRQSLHAKAVNDFAKNNQLKSKTLYRPYQSMHGSIRETNSDIDHKEIQIQNAAAPKFKSPMPPILQHQDQKYLVNMQRIATAGNQQGTDANKLALQRLYVTHNGFKQGNRIIKTNQQNQRSANHNYHQQQRLSHIVHQNGKYIGSDFISLREDGKSSEFIKTLAGEEIVTNSNSQRSMESPGSNKKIRVKDQNATLTSDTSLKPLLQLEISLKDKHNKSKHLAALSGAKKQSQVTIDRLPMNSVYRGMMPVANSSEQMGVTIRSSTVRQSPNKIGADAEYDEAIGRTYMNSFLHRYRRQSPKQLRDAEKAFLKKLTHNRQRKPLEVSPLKAQLLKKQKANGSQSVQSRTIDDMAYKTMSYLSNITSGSISLIGQNNIQNKTQLNQPAQSPIKHLVPLTERQSLNARELSSHPIGSKWYQNISFQNNPIKNSQDRMSQQSLIRYESQNSGRESQITVEQNEKQFLRDTRTEQQIQMTEQMLIEELQADPRKLLLNQPSQDINSREQARQSITQPSSKPIWRQVPLQSRDSTGWPADFNSHQMQTQNALKLLRQQQQEAQFTNRSKQSSPSRSQYKGNNEVHLKQQNSAMNTTQLRASSQLRAASITSIQWQGAAKQKKSSKPKPDKSYISLYKYKQQPQAIKHMTNVHNSPTRERNLFSNKGAVSRQKKTQKRAVGGQKLNQVGTLYKGSWPQQQSKDALQDRTTTEVVGQSVRANSTLAVGASKRQIDARWLEYEQMQQTYFKDAAEVMAIMQVNSSHNIGMFDDEGDLHHSLIKQASSVSSVSPRTNNTPQDGRRITRERNMPHKGNALSSQKSIEYQITSADGGVSLHVDGISNAQLSVQVPKAKDKTATAPKQSLPPTRHIKPGDTQGDKRLDSEMSEVVVMQNIDEPGTALIYGVDKRQSEADTTSKKQTPALAAPATSAQDKIESPQRSQEVESVLKKHYVKQRMHPGKKETLTLIEQPFQDVKQYQIARPKVALITSQDKQSLRPPNTGSELPSATRQNTGGISRNNQQKPTTSGSCVSPSPNIIIGGSLIQSNQRLPAAYNKSQSPVNVDLASVMKNHAPNK